MVMIITATAQPVVTSDARGITILRVFSVAYYTYRRSRRRGQLQLFSLYCKLILIILLLRLISSSVGQSESLRLGTMATNEDLELLPCSFQLHDFHDQVGEVRMHCQIMQMEKSLYVWVGDYSDQSMKDLALAFAMENEPKKPISTKIFGPIADEESSNLATRLSKKSGKPVYVSFNISADNVTLPNIEKRIHEEFKKHPEFLE